MAVRAKSLFSAYLIFTIFASGASVMLIEITGARIIAPLFGSSVFVWTAVISVTLLSLALGYFAGGKSADKVHTPGLLYHATFLSGAYLFFTLFIKKIILTLSAQLDIKLGALVSSVILFAPPLFLLGMITPLAVKLYTTQMERLGSRVGVLYFFSTLGSFLGTLLVGFILIPQFGVSKILVFSASFLIALALFYYVFFAKNLKWLLSLAILFPAVFFLLEERLSEASVAGVHLKEIYKTESFYGNLKVMEVNKAYRFLLIDGANQGGVNLKDGSSAVVYTYVLEKLAYMACPDTKRALVIGLGPGTIPNDFSKNGIITDVVDIDSQIVSIYKKYFARYGVPEKLSIFVDDGRCFIKRHPGKYDIVILDVLLGDTSPWHLLTVEAFSDIRANLDDRGALLINFIGLPQDNASRKIIRSLHKTLAEVFPYVSVFNASGILGNKAQNMFFMASQGKSSFNLEVMPAESTEALHKQFLDDAQDIIEDRSELYTGEAFLLTDDYNPLDFYNAKTRESWRRDILASADKALMLE